MTFGPKVIGTQYRLFSQSKSAIAAQNNSVVAVPGWIQGLMSQCDEWEPLKVQSLLIFSLHSRCTRRTWLSHCRSCRSLSSISNTACQKADIVSVPKQENRIHGVISMHFYRPQSFFSTPDTLFLPWLVSLSSIESIKTPFLHRRRGIARYLICLWLRHRPKIRPMTSQSTNFRSHLSKKAKHMSFTMAVFISLQSSIVLEAIMFEIEGPRFTAGTPGSPTSHLSRDT